MITIPGQDGHVAVQENKFSETLCRVIGSDVLWDTLGCTYFGLAAFYPLRRSVQRLATRYRDRPAAFTSALQRLLDRYWARRIKDDPYFRWLVGGFLHFKERLPDLQSKNKSPAFPDSAVGLSRRQLQGLVEGASLMERYLFCQGLQEYNKEQVNKIFRSLSAERPGPRSVIKERILRLSREAAAQGKNLTHGQLASHVFDGVATPACYGRADGHERRRLREVVRLALRSSRQSHQH